MTRDRLLERGLPVDAEPSLEADERAGVLDGFGVAALGDRPNSEVDEESGGDEQELTTAVSKCPNQKEVLLGRRPASVGTRLRQP